MTACDALREAHQFRPALGKHSRADDGVHLHELELFTGQRTSFEQNAVRDTDLSDIVERRGAANQLGCRGLQLDRLRQHRRDFTNALGVIPGVVVAELDRDRQSLQNLELRLLQLASALYDLVLELRVLIPQTLIEELRLEQVTNAQQHFTGIERLAD